MVESARMLGDELSTSQCRGDRAGFGQSLGALVLKRAIPTNLLAALSAIAKLKQLPKQIITDILCQTECCGNPQVAAVAPRLENPVERFTSARRSGSGR
jgi:hypothetical protein